MRYRKPVEYGNKLSSDLAPTASPQSGIGVEGYRERRSEFFDSAANGLEIRDVLFDALKRTRSRDCRKEFIHGSHCYGCDCVSSIIDELRRRRKAEFSSVSGCISQGRKLLPENASC
ncbi:hypothetical protein HFO55_34765 [Rhizobium leguminosarum]|uniref:hypothetical protein n=1 Tax=Rhizobium leguminosarum TaxID=384 RepID=UPI001C973B36|nr:hypothetical protein [Rhizobium leguminosarum]MBY5572260.1 hypothetical protein [Rhizobium leguminosarum]MBY5578934.1 hypothetical protein [Rhizobium leguminosarum]